MNVNLTCCCGARLNAEDLYTCNVKEMVEHFHEQHKKCVTPSPTRENEKLLTQLVEEMREWKVLLHVPGGNVDAWASRLEKIAKEQSE